MSVFAGYGNLTSDPVGQQAGTRYVVRFRMASNDSYVKDGERVEAPPVFTKVEYWGELAREFEKQAKQGTPVVVAGDWRASEWEQDGEKRRQQFVRAEAVGIQPMPPKRGSDRAEEAQAAADEPEKETSSTEADGDGAEVDDFFGGQ